MEGYFTATARCHPLDAGSAVFPAHHLPYSIPAKTMERSERKRKANRVYPHDHLLQAPSPVLLVSTDDNQRYPGV
jgi:hypothetical protein